MIKILVACLALGLNAYVYWMLGTAETIPPRAEFAQMPDELDDWHCRGREELGPEILDKLGVSDYLSCAFWEQGTGRAIHAYVGYHQRQTRDPNSGESLAIHPPEHCMPGSGWDVIDASIVPIEAGSGGEAKRFVIAKGNLRSLVYFWYHSRGRVIVRNHEKILYMFYDRARTGRSDGALVRFTIPIVNGDIEAAEATFADFSEKLIPYLVTYVPD